MPTSPLPLRFSARVITGRGRGRTLDVPTLNLDLRDVPPGLPDGLFAGRSTIDGIAYAATIHHGSRPTFNDTRSCEVHVIDASIPSPPGTLDIEIIELLRPIAKFPSAEALTEQMHEDMRRTKEILKTL